MSDQDPASEHLRIIRQLMERATVYRSIAAPVALVGGVVALGLAWAAVDAPATGAPDLQTV